MNTDQLKPAYEKFFVNSEEGKYLLDLITMLIEQKHANAEDKPEMARDFVQQAKGLREVTNHIKGVLEYQTNKK